MSRHALRRPVATVMAALAVAGATAGAAQLTHTTAADRPAPCSRYDGRGGDGAVTGRDGLPGLPVAAAASGCALPGALPDKPEDRLSVVDKARIVVLMADGEARDSEVAAQYRVSEDQVAAWKRQLLLGDWFGLLRPDQHQPRPRQRLEGYDRVFGIFTAADGVPRPRAAGTPAS
ncbi:helix-turn-helix domain-containing protein [Actinacidiphila sp. bgisy160]|uniref:helix-turn-helix domain-containing protein n=1 Tax=Actinacidiphila sp. bgisy160 TaxID=3413796 RepID=UPI003D729169